LAKRLSSRQRATRSKQWAKSDGQQVVSKENEQRARSKEQLCRYLLWVNAVRLFIIMRHTKATP
jgi:hypothetical protein